MMKAAQPWGSGLFGLTFAIIFMFGLLVKIAVSQTNTTTATTDPSEARILNSIFQRWRISATYRWNISGELCSGAAIDSTSIADFNPAIKCDCSAYNRTLCHITGLSIYAMDFRDEIPDELWSLTFLDDLNLAQNYLTGTLSPSIGNLTRMKWLSVGTNALSGEIPKELGLLTELQSLSFGTNNFSGPLPSELGDLTKLTQMFRSTRSRASVAFQTQPVAVDAAVSPRHSRMT